MPRKKTELSKKALGIVVISVIVITIAGTGLMLWLKKGKNPEKPGEPVTKNMSEKIRIPISSQPVIDYNKLEKDKELKALMKKRKAEYGVEKGLDLIAYSDESIKIGDSTIPMQEVLDKIRIKSGDIVEKDIELDKTDPDNKIQVFGIQVVKAGDNIWNIHFNFLKDYFDRKGISLSPLADEPDNYGLSSGVGKILKFSENTVYIYNIKERKLDIDLNLILPLNKIVVYNMSHVFSLLSQIDYSSVNRIRFDGETIWIPAEQ